MTQSHYSLRWNNHQNHILAAFDALLQAETLVDVTLVCAETSVRAHKVVLSACSPFFQRIFSENPCKHPVIVLKDFTGWEVQSIVDFMYKGEISVVQEQLQNLIKAAESLQVRGLANQEPLDKENCNQGQERSRSPSPHFFDNTNRSVSPFLPIMSKFEPILKGGETRNERLGRGESQSPIPRRKQARPRRRSGECAPQDLSMNKSQSHSAPSPPLPIQMPPSTPLNPLTASSENMDEQEEEVAENLCIKKRDNDEKIEDSRRLDNKSPLSEDIPSPLPPPPPNAASNMMLMMMSPPEMDLSLPPPSNNNNNQPLSALSPINLNLQQSTTPTLQQQQLSPQHGTAINLKQEMDSSHSPLPPFPPMPSVSALAMTPPHSKFFGLDSPLGLFPPMDGCRNPLFDLPDPRTTPPEPQLFVKKKMGRPKGQHSAPRGGPPRSWTNAELTEALQHVWNKKMTTSQASRIFGIPYNSLLMYVRGKYGKSLKLEQLRKDCISGPPLDLLTMGGSGNNNNNCKSASSNNSTASEEPLQPNRPPSNPEEPPHPPLFNPFAPNFYPDFAAAAAGGFPIPVSMIHLLPQSEKSHHQFLPPGLESGKNISEDADKMQTDEEAAFHLHHQQLHSSHQQLLRPPSLPSSMGVEEQRREILQQNGQD